MRRLGWIVAAFAAASFARDASALPVHTGLTLGEQFDRLLSGQNPNAAPLPTSSQVAGAAAAIDVPSMQLDPGDCILRVGSETGSEHAIVDQVCVPEVPVKTPWGGAGGWLVLGAGLVGIGLWRLPRRALGLACWGGLLAAVTVTHESQALRAFWAGVNVHARCDYHIPDWNTDDAENLWVDDMYPVLADANADSGFKMQIDVVGPPYKGANLTWLADSRASRPFWTDEIYLAIKKHTNHVARCDISYFPDNINYSASVYGQDPRNLLYGILKRSVGACLGFDYLDWRPGIGSEEERTTVMNLRMNVEMTNENAACCWLDYSFEEKNQLASDLAACPPF